MNILPKKRWHVRTKDNIARVRRDEANAADEEKQKQFRIQLAEQEARTDLLRQKAKERDQDNFSINTLVSTQSLEVQQDHVNFFSKLEKDGGYKGGVNLEHEAEKKAEQTNYEKKIGALTFLGQNSSESLGETPWYLKAHDKRLSKTEQSTQEESKSIKRKSLQDPLLDIRGYLDQKSGSSKHHKSSKKSKKEKKEKRIKHDKSKKSSKTIEELRAERTRREREEKEKARLLIAKARGDVPATPDPPKDERQHKYNSQFNPHLARQSNYKA